MVKYEIDKNRQVVAAMYEDGELDVKGSLYRMINKIIDCNSIVNIDIDIDKILNKYKKQGRFTLIGVARCHKEDNWDEEKGKEIARNRLNRKFIVLKNDIMRDLITRLDNVYVHTVHKLMYKLYGKEVLNKKFKLIGVDFTNDSVQPSKTYHHA